MPSMIRRALLAYRHLPIAAGLRAKIRMRIVRALPWLFPRYSEPGRDPRDLRPAPRQAERTDFIFFGVIDWHLRLQRPQHLAMNLAASGHRVFYLSSNLTPASATGFRVEALDESGRLFQVFLNASDVVGIYYELPSTKSAEQIAQGLARMIDWAGCDDAVALVQHPFWLGAATAVPHGLLVYDRMDFHQGFGDWPPVLAAAEADLIRRADLTVVSSCWLDQATAPLSSRRALIRNAAQYGHFAERPATVFADGHFGAVIGYFGAIAPWMDLDLVEALAQRFPQALVLLIGHDQAGAAGRFRAIENIRLLGEVPYHTLPYYLYGFTVCLLPFQVCDLTLATNPVKVYEYLSAGLPVVATDLPETREFGDLVYRGSDRASFLDAVGMALHEREDDPIRELRRQYASLQTWESRTHALIDALDTARDRAPVVTSQKAGTAQWS